MTLLKNEVAAFGSLLRKAEKDKSLFATHISLMAALFVFWQRNGFKSPFNVNRKELMAFSKIASVATYHKCMRELDGRGYINTHRPFIQRPAAWSIGFHQLPQPLLSKFMRNSTIGNQNVSRNFSSRNNISGYFYNSKVLSRNRKEQADAGRSPALLALRFAAGVLRILRGYLLRFLTEKQKKKDTWQYPV